MIEFIEQFDAQGLVKLFKKSYSIKKKILKQLKKYTVSTMHLEKNIDLNIIGFTKLASNRHYFKPKMTVEKHFRKMHKISLNFFDLPCLISKVQTRPNKQPTFAYWPLEVLKVKLNKII